VSPRARLSAVRTVRNTAFCARQKTAVLRRMRLRSVDSPLGFAGQLCVLGRAVSQAQMTIELRPLMIREIILITTHYHPCALASLARSVSWVSEASGGSAPHKLVVGGNSAPG
jgi:hypothetical protein